MNTLSIIIFSTLVLHVASYPILSVAYRNARSYHTRRRIMWALITSMSADLISIFILLKYYFQ